MDRVQKKPNSSVQYTPSSESFQVYRILPVTNCSLPVFNCIRTVMNRILLVASLNLLVANCVLQLRAVFFLLLCSSCFELNSSCYRLYSSCFQLYSSCCCVLPVSSRILPVTNCILPAFNCIHTISKRILLLATSTRRRALRRSVQQAEHDRCVHVTRFSFLIKNAEGGLNVQLQGVSFILRGSYRKQTGHVICRHGTYLKTADVLNTLAFSYHQSSRKNS
jgi:hypothetical protein